MLRPGENFHFEYQQPCRQQIEFKSIGIFFVFRETVNYDDSSNDPKSKDVDRLIQQFTHEGRVYAAGEMIREKQQLQIPARAMSMRNSLMERKNAEVKTLWVVKVQLDLGNHTEFWKEYEVEVDGEPVDNLDADSQRQVQQFDVFLTRGKYVNSSRIIDVMSALLPHLRPNQISTLYGAAPCLIMERVSQEQAKNAKERLEAAGAKVEIKPAKLA